MNRLSWQLLVLALLRVALPASPAGAQRVPDTVFIVPGSHLDLGFTAPFDAVRAQRIQNLDRAIDRAERDPTFVWFEEGGWAVDAWLDQYRADPRQIGRLRALVQRRQIGVGATLLSPYAAAFPEALPLITLHLDRIQRELGRRPTVAVINDVPAVPEALIDALAAAGIRYLLMGPNLMFSPPLPGRVTNEPFYWASASGARVLVAIDPDGYQAGLNRWLLPPDCIRALDATHFGSLSDDSIMSLGVGAQLRHRASTLPLSIVQHSLDNSGPECVTNLAAAANRWNQRANVARLVVATPDEYFRHVETRFGRQLAVRHGEWGGDWDLLRASEPVWSWRLRQAIHAISAGSSRELRIAAVTATDHNMGLGPRWLDGLPESTARQHIAGVLDVYRRVVAGGLGRIGLTAVPAAVPAPAAGAWPGAWRAIVGDHDQVARVRAGPAFIYPFVSDSAPVVPPTVAVSADARRLVIHAAIDRVRLEQRLGARYQAVLEVTLRAPIGGIRMAPEHSMSGRAGQWLMGISAERVVAPEGVRITGPGWTISAHGPLLIGWTLRADPHDRSLTRLQALALVHAVEGTVDGGRTMRLPFAEMYPGEPAVPVFDLELVRQP
jgi:hypothetical protein